MSVPPPVYRAAMGLYAVALWAAFMFLLGFVARISTWLILCGWEGYK